MMCSILFTNYGHGPTDQHGCHLQVGHTCPHEFVARNGRVYRWETDWECGCESDECDCSIYWEHNGDAPAAAGQTQ